MSQDENTAVKEPVVQQDTTQTESATVEEKAPEVADTSSDTGEYVVGETEGQSEDAKPEEGVQADDTATDKSSEASDDKTEETNGQPQSKADERKQQLNTEIRDLVSQRNMLREQVEQLNSQAYRPATEQELLDQVNPETGEYYNRVEAKIAAMEQRQELERYNSQVAEAQLTLGTEAQRALRDFPIFDPLSSEYKPEVAAQVDQLLGANLVFDQNTGQVIGSHTSPYQLYQTVANSMQASAVAGQLEGQRATEKMLASADNAGGVQQSETPFSKLSASEQAAKLRAKGYDI